MCDQEKNLVLDVLYLPNEQKLIPEPDKSGNVEYKLRLDRKETAKIDNMVSQMLWRMNEGKNQFGRYEAHYILGIKDDGNFSDMNERALDTTVNIFRGITKKANSKIISEKTYVFPGNKMITHIVVRKEFPERNVPEANVLIMGPSNAGKSSLMGRLTYGQNDDGNGFSRKLVLRHVHEKTTGSTSCPKYDTIGFSKTDIMNYAIGMDFSMENIYNSSDRLINLIDVPGDMKFIKTILYSVSSIHPDHIIVCIPFTISSDRRLTLSDQEHILTANELIDTYKDDYTFIVSLCITYNIKPIFVFTKCDLIKHSDQINIFEYYLDTINSFNRLGNQLKENSINFNDCACVHVSNITDVGYNELITILSSLTMNKNTLDLISPVTKDKLFVVIDSFTIPDTGHIIHGVLKHGVINVDDEVDVLCHGLRFKKKVRTIHRKTLDVDKLLPGESGSITFYGKIDKYIDKTAVIIGPSWDKHIVTKAKIRSVFSDKMNKIKAQQYMLFVDNNIVTVILSQDTDSVLTESEIFDLTCVNNFNFVLDTDIGILKDEQQNYYFIYFV